MVGAVPACSVLGTAVKRGGAASTGEVGDGVAVSAVAGQNAGLADVAYKRVAYRRNFVQTVCSAGRLCV